MKLMEGGGIGRADPDRGRFRSFLLVSFRNYINDEHKRENTVARGGGVTKVPLDIGAAEDRYRLEPIDDVTPERAYERRWARAVLEHALGRLRDDFTAQGRPRVFDAMRPFLQGGTDVESQADAAARIGMTAGNFRIALHRARKTYAAHVRDEARATVLEGEDIEDEIDHLLEALRP